MIAAEPVTHIRLDENGVAWIDDANVKVIEIAVDKIARNSTPEEAEVAVLREGAGEPPKADQLRAAKKRA